MRYSLLEKTELWVAPVSLKKVDLDACARAVGQVLGLDEKGVMVTDAQEGRLVFDVLEPTVEASAVVARRDELLSALSRVPGVELDPDVEVHSDGILGLINLDPGEGRRVLQRSESMAENVLRAVKRRVKVFSTGTELIEGSIKDTNTPFLLEELAAMGYDAVADGPLPDERNRIALALRDAAEGGYGLAITTGGVGAEGKDQTVEAMLCLDPAASAPYAVKFTQGEGRHAKEGVRLAVGGIGARFTMVALPGPNDEVRLMWPVLRRGLCEGWPAQRLADALAATLGAKFMGRRAHHS